MSRNIKSIDKTIDNIKPTIRAKSNSRSFSILIVDDDALVIDFLNEFLSAENIRIITSTSGEDALDKIKTESVDVALVDFKMPGMDGLEFIEKIADSHPETVSILMTGFPTLDSSIKAIKLGASDYLLKPFKLEEVSHAIDRALNEREVRRETLNLKKRLAQLAETYPLNKNEIKVNDKVSSLANHRHDSDSTGSNK